MIYHGIVALSKYSMFMTINFTLSEVRELGGRDDY